MQMPAKDHLEDLEEDLRGTEVAEEELTPSRLGEPRTSLRWRALNHTLCQEPVYCLFLTLWTPQRRTDILNRLFRTPQ
jgi:hypothetical protein